MAQFLWNIFEGTVSLRTPMHSPAVDCRFKRVAGFALLLASLTPLNRLQGSRADDNTYSHGTTTCLGEKDTPGIRLFLMQTNRCDANLYPRVEIEIRKLPIAIQKSVIIGPDNWAFRCVSADEPCEQIPSGVIVFDNLVNGSTEAGLESKGHYELRLRGGAGVVERGSFKVDCLVPCSSD